MKKQLAIICIESKSTHSELLYEWLSQQCSLHYQVIPFSMLETWLVQNRHSMCFIDYDLAIAEKQTLDKLIECHQDFVTSVYNAPKNIATSHLLMLGRIKGYLQKDLSKDQFIFNVKNILSGQYCLPESISSQLIDYYQSLTIRYNEPYKTSLTRRELQVLSTLRNGLSNFQLSDELFISEHTIKSHLYNIFKKINVSSRSEAIRWAHKYLP